MRLRDLQFFRGKSPEPACVHESDDLVVLTAEDEWFVGGPTSDLDVLAAALPRGAVKPSNTRLRMKFINEVGRFALPGGAVLELSSGKWRERDFDAMLADLGRIAAGLPFAERDGPGATHSHDTPRDASSAYHAFVYLRQILSPGTPRSEQLSTAITAILAGPHERMVTEQRPLPVHQARVVAQRALERAVTGGGRWERASSEQVSRDWTRVYGERVPHALETSVARASRDTAENQFVKHFLLQARAVVRALGERCDGSDGSDATFNRRIVQEAGQMARTLDGMLAAPLWRGVGALRQVPAASRVLQESRGYVDILRHDIRLRCLSRVSALRDLWRDLLALKQVSRLYEIWCFFVVVETLAQLLGEPLHATVVRQRDSSASLPEGVEITWPGGVRALYNTTFAPGRPNEGPYSYSVELRPDICVIVPAGPAPGLYIFDAKFARASEHDVKTRDLHKMHVYRDALRMRTREGQVWRVHSAWALFPGGPEGITECPAEDGISAITAGVGAIPLLPAQRSSSAMLSAMLSTMLGRR